MEKTQLITLSLLLNNDASLLYLRIYLEDGAGLEPALQPLTPSLASLSLRPSSFSVQELESLKLSSQSTPKYKDKYQYRSTVFFTFFHLFWIGGPSRNITKKTLSSREEIGCPICGFFSKFEVWREVKI